MKNILLVDDEQQAVDIFEAALKEGGNTVIIAKDAKSAQAAAKGGQFDIILVDEMMPDMSGNDLIKELRKDDATSKTPILVLTNYSDDNLVKEAMAAGANDYVLKYQMVPEDLAAKVAKLVGE